jgi:hypothetical protein
LLTAALVLVGLATVAATTPPDNLPHALAAQRRLVAQHPTDAAAWNDLGNLLVLGEFQDEAEDAYRRAVELAPEAPALHFNLGLLLQEEGKLRPAAEAYRKVVELEPGNAWAHYQLGAIFEARGEPEKAIASYGRALRLDPSLAFPDVNPHVIESDLLTEAMLRSYRRGLVQPQAPRVYQEPGRITALLLTPGDGGDGEMEGGDRMAAEEPAMGEPAGETAGEPTAASAPGAGGGGTEGDDGDRRVLREQDLQDGPVNQATPQGRGGYRPPSRVTAGRTPSTVRSWRPPTQPTRNDGRTDTRSNDNRGGTVVGGTVVGGTAPGSPSQPSAGSARPQASPGPTPTIRRTPVGVNSTGSLDVYLAPADERQG